MPGTVYLEAAARTQDLLTTKWVLRRCGYAIASTWHEESVLPASGPRGHWTSERLEELKKCDTLVVVRGPEKQVPLELAYTVGFAAARNVTVIWVGSPMDLPGCVNATQFVATLDEFRKQLVLESDSRRACSVDGPLAA